MIDEQTRKLLETFIERTPAKAEDHLDLSQLPTQIQEMIPAEMNPLILQGKIVQHDFIPLDEIVAIKERFGAKWNELQTYTKLQLLFGALRLSTMQEIEHQIKHENKQQRFKTWGVQTNQEIKNNFITKKMGEIFP